MLDMAAGSSKPAACAISSGAAPILLRGLGGLPAKEIAYDRDEEIYGESEPAEYLYCVRRGAVRTFKLLRDGRRQIDAFHLPGEYFGLSAREAHLLTAEAVGDSKIAIVRRSALESVAETDVKTSCAL
jgi:CRP/FNR family nitrogen fixation transcriptional regulator